MTGKYDDIINEKWPRLSHRKKMSMENRAAQFAPFAALTGHENALEITEKIHEQIYMNKKPKD